MTDSFFFRIEKDDDDDLEYLCIFTSVQTEKDKNQHPRRYSVRERNVCNESFSGDETSSFCRRWWWWWMISSGWRFRVL